MTWLKEPCNYDLLNIERLPNGCSRESVCFWISRQSLWLSWTYQSGEGPSCGNWDRFYSLYEILFFLSPEERMYYLKSESTHCVCMCVCMVCVCLLKCVWYVLYVCSVCVVCTMCACVCLLKCVWYVLYVYSMCGVYTMYTRVCFIKVCVVCAICVYCVCFIKVYVVCAICV